MGSQGKVINFRLDIYVSLSGGAMGRAVELLNYDIFSFVTSSETWKLLSIIFYKMISTYLGLE